MHRYSYDYPAFEGKNLDGKGYSHYYEQQVSQSTIVDPIVKTLFLNLLGGYPSFIVGYPLALREQFYDTLARVFFHVSSDGDENSCSF